MAKLLRLVALFALVQGDEVCPKPLQWEFGVVVICHSRSQELIRTLHSLLNVRGIEKTHVVAVQDGQHAGVAQVVQEHQLALVQREDKGEDKDTDAAARIARHYRFALEKGFEMFPRARALLIVEDDLELAEDWAEFLIAAAYAAENDGSIWAVSGWNDNGFEGLVKSPRRAFRTDQFPGLGWLLLKKVWNEIRSEWPQTHWDWHLRNYSVSKGRDVVVPEISRVHHFGANGSFTNSEIHNKFFARMVLNTDSRISWTPADFLHIQQPYYDSDFLKLLCHNSVHIKHGRELMSSLSYVEGLNLVCWLRFNPDPIFEFLYKPLAKRFGLWHQPLRGSWKGVLQFRFRNSMVTLINIFDPAQAGKKGSRKRALWFHKPPSISPWASVMPPGVRVFRSGRELAGEMDE